MKKKTKGRVKKFQEERIDYSQRRRKRRELSGKDKKRKRIRIHSGRMALTVIVIILITVLGVSVKNIFMLQAEKKALVEENKALLLEKQSLQDELKNVSDPEYIEEQARIQLKLIKPGEIIYILENQQEDREKTNEEDN